VPRIVREATVEWRGSLARGAGTVRAGTAAFQLPVDLPSRVDDDATKTSPEELLAAAHASCYVTSLAGEIARAGGTVHRLDVRCTVTMDEVGGKGHLIVGSEIDAVADADGIDGTTLDAAAREADEGCPFSTLVRASATVSVRARLSSDRGGGNGD
jgi:osmotically inducible protein OsmC